MRTLKRWINAKCGGAVCDCQPPQRYTLARTIAVVVETRIASRIYIRAERTAGANLQREYVQLRSICTA